MSTKDHHSKEPDGLLPKQTGPVTSKQSIPTQAPIPDYLKRLNAKLMNDRVGQCFILLNVKKRIGGVKAFQKETK